MFISIDKYFPQPRSEKSLFAMNDGECRAFKLKGLRIREGYVLSPKQDSF